MLQRRLNLRNKVAIAACLAVAIMFSGCDKKEKEDETSAPGAVVNLTATAGDKEVSVTWNAPADDGGAAITGYEVTSDNWANKVTKTASELTHTYTGLTNGTEYTVKVRAVNAKGAGAESTATAKPANAPGAVENFTATESSGEVSLAWDAPLSDGGAAITGYEVTMDNWTNKVTKTASELTHTYTGLTDDTEYTFKVRAVNAKGAGAESTATATPTSSLTYYSIDDDGVKYALLIEKDPSRTESAYTPQAGDKYRFATLQPSGSCVEFRGIVTGFKNGNPTEIMLDYNDWDFSAIIEGDKGMTKITGHVPGNPVSASDFMIILKNLDDKWYRFRSNTPFDYFIMIDPLYWGVYEHRIPQGIATNIFRYTIFGNMVLLEYATAITGYKLVFDYKSSFNFAWTDKNSRGETALYATNLLDAVLDYLLGAPMYTLPIQELGQFTSLTTFMRGGSAHTRKMDD